MVRKRRKSSPVEHTEVYALDDARLAEVSNALRAKYESVTNEAIPERLQRLVDMLRAKESEDKETR